MKKVTLDVEKLEMAASKLRAIAHPMRIAIIDLLTVNPKMTVTEIYEYLNLEQASASHHLNILKNKGLLDSKRDGKMIYYSLKFEHLTTVAALAESNLIRVPRVRQYPSWRGLRLSSGNTELFQAGVS
jgi:DNA-binding transcriptional ArsR family regulator